MTTPDRFETVKKLNLCLNCLGSGHRIAQCSSRSRCRSCNQAYYTLLHHDKDIPAIEARPHPITFFHLHTQPGQVILATAVVLVKNASGSYRPGRALLGASTGSSPKNFVFVSKNLTWESAALETS